MPAKAVVPLLLGLWAPGGVALHHAHVITDGLGDAGAGAACARLRDHGAHFTAEVEVGTPPQTFDVVADTGSSSLIVSSCLCRTGRSCFPHSKCFHGTGNSSTFSVNDVGGRGPEYYVMRFGSGDIKAAFASDLVRVGHVPAMMENALLLMVDHHLKLKGPFEGILGLGPPGAEVPGTDSPQVPGFLEKAGVRRFSICFMADAGGALQLNASLGPKPLGSLGRSHWALGLQGVSVGNASAPMAFCATSSMRAGQNTPCGLIPDSGTTFMMGPAEQILKLMELICDGWGRCAHAAAENPQEKHEILQDLLLDCESWSANDMEAVFEELPAIHFNVVGAGGETQTLRIPASAYLLETDRDGMHRLSGHAPSGLSLAAQRQPHGQGKFCMAALGQIDYSTRHNGPVWILGLPVFSVYRVGYDLEAVPPAIAFDESPCTGCAQPGGEFFVARPVRGAFARPRRLLVPPRLPTSIAW